MPFPRFHRLAPFLALLVALISGAWGMGSTSAPPVRVAIFPYEPGTFLDAQGRPQGLFVDILNAVAEREGWNLQFRMVPWAEGLELARRGEVDLLTTVARSDEHERILTFGTQAAHTVWTLVYVPEGHHLDDITRLRDQRVALMKGDGHAERFQAFCKAIALPYHVREYPTHEAVFQALARGEADAGVVSNLYGYWHEGRYSVHRTPVVLDPFPVYFAGPKGRSEPYLAALDRFLVEGATITGHPLHTIRERWLHASPLGIPLSTDRWILPVFLLILGIVVTLAFIFQQQSRQSAAEVHALNETLRRELELRRRSEARLEALAHLNADFLFDCHHPTDGSQPIAWVSQTFFQLTGYTEADLAQQDCWLFVVHPHDRAWVERSLNELPTGTRKTFTFRLLTQSGHLRWVRCHVETQSPSTEGFVRRLGSVEDITEQRTTEQRLLEHQTELQTVYDEAPVPLCVLNADRRVLFANRAFLTFTALPEEAVLAHRIGHVLHCCNAHGTGGCGGSPTCGACTLQEAIQRTFETGEPFTQLAHRFVRRDQTDPLHLLASGRCLDTSEGPKVLLCFQDITALKTHEAERQALLEHLHEAERVAHLGHWVIEIASQRITWSEETYRIFGIPIGTPIDYPTFLQKVHPEDRAKVNAAWHEALEKRQPYQIEHRIAVDGQIKWVQEKADPSHPRDGRIVGTVLDITERQMALDALRASEARFRTLFETHSAPFLLIEPDTGCIVDANPAAAAYHGYAREELTTLRISDINALPPEETHAHRRAALEKRQNHFIFPHRLRSGELRTVEVHSAPVLIEGRPLLFSIIYDLTERLRAEEALRQSEHRFRQILEASADAIFLHDLGPEGPRRFLDVSPSACALLGYTREELLALSPQDLHPPEAPPPATTLQEALEQRGEATFECLLVHKDGRRIPVEIRSRRIELDGTSMVLAIGRDLTDRKRAQALDTATETILAKARMAAFIAHEINNPLAGIQNAFHMVSGAIPADHPQRHYVELIQREIQRIGSIVRTMYELYHPPTSEGVDLSIQALLEELRTLLIPKMRTQRATLTLALPDSPLRAHLRADLLRQILFNLLQNALEASPPEGEVTLRVQRHDDRLCFHVEDQGPGIAPEHAERIFEAGFSTKGGGQVMGLGLGLSTARHLAEAMGGRLTFTNHDPELGCTFQLDLPYVPPQDAT